jgi:hypothetical protein
LYLKERKEGMGERYSKESYKERKQKKRRGLIKGNRLKEKSPTDDVLKKQG